MPMVHCAACGQVRGSKEGYEKERRGEERRGECPCTPACIFDLPLFVRGLIYLGQATRPNVEAPSQLRSTVTVQANAKLSWMTRIAVKIT